MEQPLQCTQGVQPVRKRKRKHRRRCKRHPQDGPHSPTCRGQKTGDVTESPALVILTNLYFTYLNLLAC